MERLFHEVRELLYYGKKSLGLLSVRDRRYLVLFLILQISLTGLDVIGVLLIALIATVATSAVQGSETNSSVLRVLEVFNLNDTTPQKIALILTISASFLLVAKSLLGFYITKRSLSFLSTRDANISSKMSEVILRQDIEQLRALSSFQYQNAITLGSGAVTSGLISQSSLLISEVVLQFALLTTIFIFSPVISVGVFLYFSIFLILLTVKLGKTAKHVSQQLAELNILTSKNLFDALQNYRLVTTTQSQHFFSEKIRESRLRIAQFNVNQAMLNVWSKYIFEIALLFAVIIFAAYAFVSFSASEAAALMAIFLASAYRIAPSIMKVQNSIVNIKGHLGSAKVFFEVFDHLKEHWNEPQRTESFTQKRPIDDRTFGSTLIAFEKVDFQFKDSDQLILKNVTLSIDRGSKVGFVGPSGAGKSTLVDLLIGALLPTTGAVTHLDLSARISVKNKMVRIGYVPQEVVLIAGSIKENIAFGRDPEGVDDELIWKILESVSMSNWVHNLPHKLESRLGEFGSKISGGQRQRIGIARALFTKPDVLILDESTSALDAETENSIMNFIMHLDRETTLIVIAHRLSTVINLDKLYYLSEGSILAEGNFQELRQLVPNFDIQAKLMGLESGN
jgi:ABC-type multidrug transport system fused ATPase/permease subunit